MGIERSEVLKPKKSTEYGKISHFWRALNLAHNLTGGSPIESHDTGNLVLSLGDDLTITRTEVGDFHIFDNRSQESKIIRKPPLLSTTKKGRFPSVLTASVHAGLEKRLGNFLQEGLTKKNPLPPIKSCIPRNLWYTLHKIANSNHTNPNDVLKAFYEIMDVKDKNETYFIGIMGFTGFAIGVLSLANKLEIKTGDQWIDVFGSFLSPIIPVVLGFALTKIVQTVEFEKLNKKLKTNVK